MIIKITLFKTEEFFLLNTNNRAPVINVKKSFSKVWKIIVCNVKPEKTRELHQKAKNTTVKDTPCDTSSKEI